MNICICFRCNPTLTCCLCYCTVDQDALSRCCAQLLLHNVLSRHLSYSFMPRYADWHTCHRPKRRIYIPYCSYTPSEMLEYMFAKSRPFTTTASGSTSCYELATTPTFAGRMTLPFNIKPFCCVWKTVWFSLSGCGAWKTASCLLGSNFSFSTLGSNRSSPCFFSVCIRMVSVIFRPECRLTRSWFVSFNFSSGTLDNARSRLSMLSKRSFVNRWRA
jgi:hypothetical protein